MYIYIYNIPVYINRIDDLLLFLLFTLTFPPAGGRNKECHDQEYRNRS